ncbi:MAG TPA: phosphopyruvate hydratase [Solirubrobacteraceae bacterium]|nr:phosphopyruvate hydratase [Solirubrobacteraceae bacterium]
MSPIATIHARQILDSRGYPTVEVEVTLDGGQVGRSAVPTGSSTGRREAAELRDGGDAWSSMGVGAAVDAVRAEIAPALQGRDPDDQAAIDRTLLALDGTRDKSRLGANAILATSVAVARAAAAERREPLWRYLARGRAVQLPVPLLDVLNGGVHAANRLDFEEFMIIPAGAETFSDALRIGVEVFHELRYTLLARGRGALMGGDGGFAPDLESNESALETLVAAIRSAGYEPGWDVWIGVDAAASQLRQGDGYPLAHEGRQLSSRELVAYYDELADRYPLLLLEDGMDQDDWEGWQELTAHLGQRIELAGDDLFVTSAEQLRDGITSGVANAVVIKPNQVGTLTETLETVAVAQAGGYGTVMAQRSGETEDTSICDLAVATGSMQIKAGAPSRERVAKYNRLLRIEEMLGPEARFAGLSAFYPDKWDALR